MDGLDTSSAALERKREAFRRMTPEQRVALAAEMSDEIRAIAESGIRHRHPAFSDEDVQAALAGILLGREAARRGRGWRASAAR